MNKVYIITGPAGVGKSAISQQIAESIDNSVLIEGDSVYHMVVGGYVPAWKEGNHLEMFWENMILLTNNSIANGYDVVLNYIIYPDTIELIKSRLKNVKIKFVVLMVDEKEIVRIDNLREKDCRMGERSLLLLKHFKDVGYKENHILDSTNLGIEETVEAVLKEHRLLIK